MNATLTAARAGLTRDRIELWQTPTNAQDLWAYLFPAVAMLVAMFFMRNATVPGVDFSLGAWVMPSILGMNIAFAGLVNLAQQLIVEREDGTLLRRWPSRSRRSSRPAALRTGTFSGHAARQPPRCYLSGEAPSTTVPGRDCQSAH